MNVPALSFHKPERQGQGSLVSKIRKKGWASPPQKIPAQAELGRATPRVEMRVMGWVTRQAAEKRNKEIPPRLKAASGKTTIESLAA